MMKTKEEMMKKALEMGVNMGAMGCIAVLTTEEMEMLLTDPKSAETPKVDEAKMRAEITAQLYVDMIDELIEKLAVLGYHIIFNGDSYENYDGLEIDHKNQVVDVLTW